ncbi:MAG: hypothetical protein AAFV47_09450 [Pseudomonadota bacterium]
MSTETRITMQICELAPMTLGAMRMRTLVVLAGHILLSACGKAPEQTPLPTLKALAAEQAGVQIDIPVPVVDDAMMTRGETLWARCSTCHQIGPGARNMAGPQLNELIGRRVAALSDFNYSEALSEVDMAWTAQALDVWLTAPYRTVPGTTMSFGGISDSYDRAALIGYIYSTSDRSDDPF